MRKPRKQLATTAVASAVLTLIVSSALGDVDGARGLGVEKIERKFQPAVDWLATHPSEFQTFLKALQDGDDATCESIIKLAALSSVDLPRGNRKARRVIEVAGGHSGAASGSAGPVTSKSVTTGSPKMMRRQIPGVSSCW